MGRAVFEGYRSGRRFGWLIGADWESLVSGTVEEIREQFAVQPASYYPRILAAARSAAAGEGARPATPMVA